MMNSTSSTVQKSASYIPHLKQLRRNVRLIVFLSIAALPFLVGIVYPMVDYQIHHGIKHGVGCDQVDLRSLGYFPLDGKIGTIEDVPPRWRALDGKRVELAGFPFTPQNWAGPLTDFQLVYNVSNCCFNGPPLVQERVFAHVPPGQVMPDFTFGRLTGILHVKVTSEAGLVTSVYTLDVEKAEPGQ